MSNERQQQENQGVLFKNINKTQEKHPDYKGTCNVNGKEKDIAAWVVKKEGKTPFMSIKFSDKYVKPENQPTTYQNNSKPQVTADEDSLPF